MGIINIERVKIGDKISIDPNAVVGYFQFGNWSGSEEIPKTIIGNECIIEPFVVVYAGAEIGDRAKLFSGSNVYSWVKIGSEFFLGNGASVREHVSIGNHVKIGTNSVILPHVKLEDRVSIHSLAMIGEHVQIREGAWIGPGVMIYNTIHPKAYRCPEKERCDVEGAPVIGRHVRIGGGSIINPFVTIGDYAVVASGSVVTTDVPENAVVVGSPARIIKKGDLVICRYDDNNGVYSIEELKARLEQ